MRLQVEEIIGQGQQAPSGQTPFTPRAKKVLELARREALQLGHNSIGTEHILLGLIREGDGVAAQVLVRLGADLNRVRRLVIRLLHGGQAAAAPPAPAEAESHAALVPGVSQVLDEILDRLDSLAGRVAGIEQQLGIVAEADSPYLHDLDEQIARARRARDSAIKTRAFDAAAALRDEEKELIGTRSARQREWSAAMRAGSSAIGQPGGSVIEEIGHLSSAVARLTVLVSRIGIGPEDDPPAAVQA